MAKLGAEASTYDQQLQSVYDNSDSKRQNVGDKVTYNEPSDLPVWETYSNAKRKNPIPSEVWSQMKSSLRTKFVRAKIKKRKTKSDCGGWDGAVKLTKGTVVDLIVEAIKKNNEQNGIGGNPSKCP